MPAGISTRRNQLDELLIQLLQLLLEGLVRRSEFLSLIILELLLTGDQQVLVCFECPLYNQPHALQWFPAGLLGDYSDGEERRRVYTKAIMNA